jgi:hypothetical protein
MNVLEMSSAETLVKLQSSRNQATVPSAKDLLDGNIKSSHPKTRQHNNYQRDCKLENQATYIPENRLDILCRAVCSQYFWQLGECQDASPTVAVGDGPVMVKRLEERS